MTEDQEPIEDETTDLDKDTIESTAEEEDITPAHGPTRPYTSPEDVVRHHLRGMYRTWF